MTDRHSNDRHSGDQHLDLDALADLLAGEGAEADVEHVARCGSCAARLVELEQAQAPVAAALAALPPPPLPAGLAERLVDALADAGPLPAAEPVDDRTAVPPPDDPVRLDRLAGSGKAARTVTPLHRPRRTWLPAAAVVVLAVSAVGLAVSALPGGSGDSPTAATSGGDAAESAPEQSAASALVVNASGRDYAASPDALAAGLPAVLAGTATPAAAAPPAPAAEPLAPETSPQATEEDAELSAGSSRRSGAAALDRLRDPAALEGCLSALVPADGSVQPLAVDYAAYAGQPALVVVLEAEVPAKLDVYVVGPDCAPGRDSTLFFTRVDRPA